MSEWMLLWREFLITSVSLVSVTFSQEPVLRFIPPLPGSCQTYGGDFVAVIEHQSELLSTSRNKHNGFDAYIGTTKIVKIDIGDDLEPGRYAKFLPVFPSGYSNRISVNFTDITIIRPSNHEVAPRYLAEVILHDLTESDNDLEFYVERPGFGEFEDLYTERITIKIGYCAVRPPFFTKNNTHNDEVSYGEKNILFCEGDEEGTTVESTCGNKCTFRPLPPCLFQEEDDESDYLLPGGEAIVGDKSILWIVLTVAALSAGVLTGVVSGYFAASKALKKPQQRQGNAEDAENTPVVGNRN